MASGTATVSEADLSCPVCQDIFSDPLVLSCSHSVCAACLYRSWSSKGSRECPLCRKKSPDIQPPRNLALRNLCQAVLSQRQSTSSGVNRESPSACPAMGSPARSTCQSHGERFKLFCRDDNEPLCVVCRDSRLHRHHECQPLDEAATELKEKLKTKMKPLEDKLKTLKDMEQSYVDTAEHIKKQVENTKRRIEKEFERLHQFLRDEEAGMLEALMTEAERKTTMMEEIMSKMAAEILSLSDNINAIEKEIQAEDTPFLLNFKATLQRAQCEQQDTQRVSGALVDVAQHLGNLKFRVWRKMQELVHYSPVILDPNTADPRLSLSDDLTSLAYTGERRQLPDNPERFDWYLCVLGSAGFCNGTHSWEVDVGDSTFWLLGVTTESSQRKGLSFFEGGVWCVLYMDGMYKSRSSEDQSGSPLPVKKGLERVRVLLDMNEGEISFCNSANDTHLHTFKCSFNEKVFPFFFNWCVQSPLKVLPLGCCVTVG